MFSWATCDHPNGPVDVCGRAGVRSYLTGNRCPHHTPAALAGRTPPTPGTLPPSATRPAREYGTATTDPLGRTLPGTTRNGMIPRHPATLDTSEATP